MFAIALLVLLSLRLAVSGAAITDGLIHLWTMDERSGGIIADSVGTWDLQAQGGATLGVPGMFGFGVKLAPSVDSSDIHREYLLSSLQPTNFLQSDFTLCIWIQWKPHTGKPGILQFGDFSIDLTLDFEPVVYQSGVTGFSGNTSIADGKWHLLSFVAEGVSATLYLDDIEIGAGNRPRFGATGTLSLGLCDATHCFGGTIDEAAIYSRALSAAEVAANAVPEPKLGILMLMAGGFWLAGTRNGGGIHPVRWR